MGSFAGFVRDLKREAVSLYTATASAVKLMMALSAYEQEPPGARKAARDLSPQEALDLLMHLVYRGEISLVEHIRTDLKGKVIFPRPQQQVRVRTYMAGVSYYHAAQQPPDRNNGSSGAYRQETFQPTPTFAIVLYRLAVRLRQDFGVTRIVWGGIGASHDGSTDCHQTGRCVDFYGATMPARSLDVLADWGRQPIYTEEGRRRGPWDTATSHEINTFYRLRDGIDEPAYTFFKAVYRFATEQCTDAGNSPTAIGQHSFIIHPDHPDPALRIHHQEHMHFQVGATR